MSLSAHLSALILFAAGLAAADPRIDLPSAVMLGSDGTVIDGALIMADWPEIAAAANRKTIIGVRVPGVVPGWIDQGLVLADGDVLRGSVLSVDADSLRFAADLLGAITVPLAEVAALRISPTTVGEMVPDGFAGVVLANGDRLNGRLASVDATSVGIDTGKKVIKVPRARITQVVLRAPTVGAARRLIVRFANGDRLGGTLAAPAPGRWELTTARGAVRFAASDARGLWFEGPDRLPLATLVPTSGAVAGRDAAAAGGWLVAGAQRWDRGLCCRAPSRLDYAVPAGTAALVGEVALADGAGSALFTVLVDGKPGFASGAVAAGAPAKPFSVALSGAKTVSLVVAPGPDSDAIGARAVWGWAILVQP